MNTMFQHCTRTALFAAIAISLSGCERVVNITVADAPPQLVVEGRVERVQGSSSAQQLVVLTTSAPYFGNMAGPPARGAEVSITDGAGRSSVLRESNSQAGHYRTDSLLAVVGDRYTLRIRWAGDVYEAVDSLLPVSPIDSLYFRPRNGAVAGPQTGSTDGLRATIDLRDPPDVENYYLWDMFVDGRRISPSVDTSARTRAVNSDQLYNGVYLRGAQPFDGSPVLRGQQVRVRQHSISSQIYRYYRALNDQVSADGSPFAVPPNSLRGNVANLTRPGVRALGYFMATNISERELRVP